MTSFEGDSGNSANAPQKAQAEIAREQLEDYKTKFRPLRTYKVWSETYGDHEEDGSEVLAETPQQATETWARWFDDGVGDLEIINGKPATVTVKDIETGHVSHWFVHGEAVPVYTAKLRVGDGVTP